jgi:hypothetical protein
MAAILGYQGRKNPLGSGHPGCNIRNIDHRLLQPASSEAGIFPRTCEICPVRVRRIGGAGCGAEGKEKQARDRIDAATRFSFSAIFSGAGVPLRHGIRDDDHKFAIRHRNRPTRPIQTGNRLGCHDPAGGSSSGNQCAGQYSPPHHVRKIHGPCHQRYIRSRSSCD